MIGLLTLSEQIMCKKEVLGKTFDCEFQGIQFQISFPQYPNVGDPNKKTSIDSPLLPPHNGIIFQKSEEPLSWGFPISYPAGESLVGLLVMSIECEKSLVTEYADKLYKSIETWDHSFIDYIKLETKQYTARNKNIRRNTCSLKLLDDRYIHNSKEMMIYIRIPDSNSFASEKTIQNAISFAGSDKELLLEYQMMLSAYEARQQNQNRRAILDACSAMELVLVNQIEQYCTSIGLHSNVLLEKYRYLGDRIDLLEKIGIGFPKQKYKDLVITPRNMLMHNKSVYPTDETTDTLIDCVEAFLKYFHRTYY